MKISDKSVLLIIDVQKDFCTGGSLEVSRGEEIVPVINRIAPGFPHVTATRDWHPPGHVSFASAHPDKVPFSSVDIEYDDKKIIQTIWPDHCIAGTPGAAFHENLKVSFIDSIFHKGTRKNLDSYSGFFENDRETSTGLSGYLLGLGIENVYITGLAEDVCVYFTALDAVKEGFKVFLLTDGTRGIDTPPGTLEKRRGEMKKSGVIITDSISLGL